ncbi:hypothetical protein EV426DRAFT_687670 [Tirmania nivea]|nr:hypothetical protein EV426DRAFT_687670 [Tirmania nivea]
MKWDASTDRLLLLTILESHNITVDYESVARKIGNGCTASAVYQQLLKLRKMGAENPSNLTKKTSRKGGRGKVEDEDIKNFKPRPFLQREVKKIKQEERKIKQEELEVVIKREKGQPETGKGAWFSDVIIIDDDDADDE